jgi:hypothetical protein
VRSDLRQHGRAELLGFGAGHDDDGGGAVGDLRGRPGRHGAVGGERRAQLGQRRGGGAFPYALVVGDRQRIALTLRHGHRDDFVVEQPVLPRGQGPLVGPRGVGVLLLAREVALLAVEVGRVAHPAQVERAEQRVVRGRVHDLVVAIPVPGPRTGQQVRALRHRLHPTGDDHVELPEADQLICHGDRVEPGQADLVHRQGGHAHSDPALDRGLTGRDLARAGLDHVAHDHVVDLVAADPGALQGRRDRERAEVHRREVLERARQLSDRGTGTPDDDRTRHEFAPYFFFFGM